MKTANEIINDKTWNGKVYGYNQKSVYINNEKIEISDELAVKIEEKMNFYNNILKRIINIKEIADFLHQNGIGKEFVEWTLEEIIKAEKLLNVKKIEATKNDIYAEYYYTNNCGILFQNGKFATKIYKIQQHKHLIKTMKNV